ncbi:MAG: GNAT family N-acetyltransferase [Chloroflexi bacterium]|nr:GNAT family N-acetyltransferase [Chloroflexota bacterium]
MPTPTITIYPKTLALRDSTAVTLRPMVATDGPALLEFFLHLPEDDRFYLKDNVTAPGVIAAWARDLDYERVLPLLALVDGRIVGDATLHRRRGGARRHVGEVRVTVDPAFRGRGLGTALLHEVLDYAYQMGLESVVFELVENTQDEAIDAARRAGFVESARLINHVKDTHGKPQDLIILRLPLGKWYAWW